MTDSTPHNVNQEITRINLAVQMTADAPGLDDIMVTTSVGTHQGQFGTFIEKAPGITGKKFKSSNQSEIKAMNDADFRKVIGGMMRKLNRLQWFDMITGQDDRYADNCMIDVKFGKKAKAYATYNGKYANYSNSFFRDLCDNLIKNSNRKDRFA